MLQRYTPVRELGTNDQARTVLAVQHGGAGLRRLVVLKQLPQRGDTDRLLRRTRMLATLEHHHLARVVDQGIEQDQVLIVYDYVVGESVLSLLARCVRAGRPVPLQIAIRLTADACAGLHAAHLAGEGPGPGQGVIHGALRPSNLMLSYDGCAKVVDCGLLDLAQLQRDPVLTAAQAHFLAPEVVGTRPLDGRVDVYSAAALLYALVTLRYPHDGHDHDAAEVLRQKEIAPVVPPSARNAAIPPELERLLLAALAAAPAERPRSAATFRYELENLLIRHGRFATHLAVADYVASVFGKRIKAKRSALEELLALPPGQASAAKTTVDVTDGVDRQAVDDMFAGRVETDVDQQPAFFRTDEVVDAPPTVPDFAPSSFERSLVDEAFDDEEDTEADRFPGGDEDTAVG